MQRNGLPRFQYTIRELSCGAQFLAYSNELSKTCATLAVQRFRKNLQLPGVDTTNIIRTTDLGSELDGDAVAYHPEGFHLASRTSSGPSTASIPRLANANADVGSVHNTIETESFDAQVFSSQAGFFAKISTCQFWYNAARKNGSRGYKSPADLLQLKAPHISPRIFLLNPIPLESILPRPGGHDIPGQAACHPESS